MHIQVEIVKCRRNWAGTRLGHAIARINQLGY
jgi:hypothetical protein